MRTSFDVTRDQAEVRDTSVRTDYRCRAHGCPNMGGIGGQYGVNRSGVCAWHYAADPAEWGEVTRRMQADDTMRYAHQPDPLHAGDKRVDPKDWARALERRELAGERLTPAQREMWRSALNRNLPPAEAAQ